QARLLHNKQLDNLALLRRSNHYRRKLTAAARLLLKLQGISPSRLLQRPQPPLPQARNQRNQKLMELDRRKSLDRCRDLSRSRHHQTASSCATSRMRMKHIASSARKTA